MRIRTKSRLFVGAAIICVSQGSAVFAQSAPQTAEAPRDANEIIVTANKREENLNKVGLTITAISATALEERGISSLEDIAAVVPGLAYSSSTTNTPIFTLRGIGFQESSLGVYPAVSVYLDQVPLAFPILAAHSAFDLERIEVLKGPQGTLFGQNSTGGAINYIAAKPTKTLQAGGDIGFGRFGSIDGNAYISGPLGETLGFRLAGNAHHMNDWQQSVTRPGDTNGHQDYVAGRFLLDWQPSDAIKLEFNANGWRDKSQPQAQQLISINAQTPNAPNLPTILASAFVPDNARAADWSGTVIDLGTGVILTPEVPYGGAPGNGIGGYVAGTGKLVDFTPFANRRLWQTALRADIDISGLTLTSLTSYTDFDQKQRVDQDGNALVTFDLQRADGFIQSFSQELRLANAPSSRFRWLLGANYENSTTFENQLLRYFDNTSHNPGLNWINASGVTNRQDIKNYAAFGNLEYDVTDQLTVKAAARYTDSTIDSDICSYTTPTGRVDTLLGFGLNGTCFTINTTTGANGKPITGQLKENNVSWRVGADYKVNSDVLLYANVSRGYKAGSFPSASVALDVGLRPVTQESLTAFEGGIKASLADRKVQFNAAAFYYDYKDKQIRGKLLDPVFGALDALINIPKSRIFGLEADVTARPTEGLTINAALTYLDSKITEGPGAGGRNFNIYGVADDFTGDPLPFTPKYSGVVNIDYRYELASGGSAFVGVSMNARSRSDAAIGASRIPFPYSPSSITRPGLGGNVFNIKGYTTADARIGYEAADGAWKVMLWGKNIFDTYYWNTVIPSNDSQARFAGMPATYGITLGFKID